MNALSFAVTGARAEPYAAVPTLRFGLEVREHAGAPIQSLDLRCQIRIEPHRRRYSPGEQERLLELFGETPRWGDTLKPFLWTHAATMVPGFTGASAVDLLVPASYELEVTAAKYFHALGDGAVPLLFLFNGTVFTLGDRGLQVTQVPWDAEATYPLPVKVWRDLMDAYYPNSGWLRLHRDTIDALQRYKARRALPTWDAALTELLDPADLDVGGPS